VTPPLYASDIRAQHGVPFAVASGLNSGSRSRRIATTSDGVHAQDTSSALAQRMEALAESGHLSLDTRALVEYSTRGFGRITSRA